MKKLIVVLFSLGWLCAARPAEAALFTLQTYSLSMQTSTANGLGLWSENLMASPTTFELTNVGQTYSTNLFRLGTSETRVDPDDLRLRPINVGFGFSQPVPGFGGTATGISGALSWLGGIGYVAWNNPVTLAFGTSGLIQVSLSNIVFGVPGASTVSATFRLIRPDGTIASAGVPEPSTLFLMALAASMLALLHFRQRAIVSRMMVR